MHSPSQAELVNRYQARVILAVTWTRTLNFEIASGMFSLSLKVCQPPCDFDQLQGSPVAEHVESSSKQPLEA